MDNDDTNSASARIEQFRAFYEAFSTLELIRKLAAVRAQKDHMEAELSAVNAELRYLGEIAIPEKFAEEGVKNMSVEGVGRVNLRSDIYASVKAGKKDEAYQWLKDIGSGDLIQPTVNSSTMKAFLKGRLKQAEDIPEELFSVNPFTLAVITKG